MTNKFMFVGIRFRFEIFTLTRYEYGYK